MKIIWINYLSLYFHKLSMLLEPGNDYSGKDRELGNL